MMMASCSLRGGGGIEGHGSKRTTQDTEGSSDLRAVGRRQLNEGRVVMHNTTYVCAFVSVKLNA